MSVKVKLTNNIPQLVGDMRTRASQIVATTAHNIRSRAVLKINNPPKTGRIYKKRGKLHRASAAGQAPAGDTGYLANSIQVQMEPGNVAAAITVSAEYGEVLELGGRSMAARPYLVPAVEAERTAFEAAIKGLVATK